MITIEGLGRLKVMENRDFAVKTVRSLLEHPEWWHAPTRENCCWVSTFKAVMEIMDEKAPEAMGGMRSRDTMISVYPCLAFTPGIYAICYMRTERGSSTCHRLWLFVVHREDSLELVEVPKQVKVGTDGNLIVSYGETKHVFTCDHPVWPWPVFDPDSFRGVALLDDLAEPDEANPLTGLLASSRGETRTLAVQVKNLIAEIQKAFYASLTIR